MNLLRIMTLAVALTMSALVIAVCTNDDPGTDLSSATNELESAQSRLVEAEEQVSALQAEIEQLSERQLPDAEEIRSSAQGVFDKMAAAFAAGDAGAFYDLLSSDITSVCTQEQVAADFDSDDPFRALSVESVYVDPSDPNRGMAQLKAEIPEDDGLGGLATAFITALPWPIVLEDSDWKVNLPFLALGEGEGCPFDESGGSQESEVVEVPVRPVQPPDVEVAIRADLGMLEPFPGARTLDQGIIGFGKITISYIVLETGSGASELLSHYVNAVPEPEWTQMDTTASATLAGATWTVPSKDGEPLTVVLTVAPSSVGEWTITLQTPGPLPRVIKPVEAPSASSE